MVIFELVCGRIAFDQSGQMAILAAKLEGRAPRLRDCAVVAVPPELDALVMKALSRKPGDRFASAREMQQAWRALGAATESPRASARGQSTPSAHPTQTALTAGTHTRVGGLFPRAGFFLAAFCVLASALALVMALHKRKAPPVVAMPRERDPFETAAPPASTDSVAAVTAVTAQPALIELGPATDGGARPRTPRTWHPPHSTNHPPQQTGAHFTTEPRY